MTDTISDAHYEQLMKTAHPAVLLTVERAVTREEGAAINRAINDHLLTVGDTDDMQPIWVRFANIDTCNIYFPQSRLAPTDGSVLNGLVLAVEDVAKFTRVSSFDYRSRQYPKKKPRQTRYVPKPGLSNDPSNPGITKKIEFYPHPEADRLPLKLRFAACEEAMREAYKLGSMYDRWPFYGFDRDDLKTFAEKLVVEFAERYPYLAEIDAVIVGKLTKVITELGKHPHQPAFERRRFWLTVCRGAVMSWSQLADDLLYVIERGSGDQFRFFEEPVEYNPATAYLHSDDRTPVTKYASFLGSGKRPALTSGIARGMVAED